jgi:hypothetical protein
MTLTLPKHPSHPTPHSTLTRTPYEVEYRCWGSFVIGVQIVLKKGYCWKNVNAATSPDGREGGMIPLYWQLDFSQTFTKADLKFIILSEN